MKEIIWANIALNDNNEIVAWHTVPYKKELYSWTVRFKCQLEAVKTKHKQFTIIHEEDRNIVFDVLAVNFYKNFKIANNYEGNRPY